MNSERSVELVITTAGGAKDTLHIDTPLLTRDEAHHIVLTVSLLIDGIRSSMGWDRALRELLPEAAELVLTTGSASVPALKKAMRIGSSRARGLIDLMETCGLVRTVNFEAGELEVLYDKTQLGEALREIRARYPAARGSMRDGA